MSISLSQLKNLKKAAEKFAFTLSDEQLEKFSIYADTLLSWNQRFNLVSKNDASFEGLIKHFIDSLVIFKFVEFHQNARLLDIGSGNGFPAVPIKIFREDLDLTLAESVRKKALFLQKVVENLKFHGMEVKNQRVESLEGSYKNCFDFATAKKVAPVPVVWKLCYPFLKVGGILLAYKGKKMEEEVKGMPKVLEKLPGELKVEEITLEEFRIKRYVVMVKKFVPHSGLPG